jgi:hypothetical protein
VNAWIPLFDGKLTHERLKARPFTAEERQQLERHGIQQPGQFLRDVLAAVAAPTGRSDEPADHPTMTQEQESTHAATIG